MRQSLFGLVLWALAVTAVAQPPRWQAIDFITQAFVEVALRNEYSDQGRFVRKWQQPLRVWINHQVADEQIHENLVGMHLRHLQAITGLNIQLVNTSQQANLIVTFTRQSRWRDEVKKQFGAESLAAVHGAVCMANFRLNALGAMEQAAVIIPVDQARMHGKLVSCVVEEITQVMGLPNDSEKVYPSIFNDKTPQELLTGLDYLLLKLLYQPEVKAGMREAEVTPIIRRLLRNWQKQGTIQSAEKMVRNGELYPLLGYGG